MSGSLLALIVSWLLTLRELSLTFLPTTVGVYKTGFATTQEAYSKAVVELFEALDRVEKLLADSGSDYLVGNTLTEADVRLFTTVVRLPFPESSLDEPFLINPPDSLRPRLRGSLQVQHPHHP